MWTDRAGGHRAASFAEVAIAVLVLALLLVPVTGVLQFNVRGTAQSVHLSRAFQTARSAADAAESFSFLELDNIKLAALVSKIPVPAGVARPRLDPIEFVSQPLGDGWLEAKIVTVRVEWERVEGVEERGEVLLRTLVSRCR